ncbi:MAG TPA: hypothetical protein VJL35_07545 [Gemmatimonadaceae bacterium]|jgi:hypothetical protein|nr:hypothetical protein [Gemmatimonadaceae bacterium]
MNAKYFLPVAAVFLAACSDVTAPSNDLAVSYGKRTTTPPPPPSSLVLSESFENGIASVSSWNLNSLTSSPGTAKMASTGFLGRLLNEEVALSIPAGMTSVTVSFDLYIIGTWDGAGQQGYGGDWWQIEVSRNGGARQNVFHTSFSNQATKPQHFPKEVTAGTSPSDKGAFATNLLGYPKASGKFDVGDAIYKLKYTISNPGGGPLVLYFHSTTPLQDLNDESWGLDNVVVSGS